MAENYKHLYQQMKKMVEKYQDEILPGYRKAIEDLMGIVAKRKWIPVTERLPEESGAYLVATERGGVFITHYSKRGQRFSISRMGSDVTHWQERPLPPKGED